jgi:hypothetical protein
LEKSSMYAYKEDHWLQMGRACISGIA